MPPKPGFDLNDTGNRIIAFIVLALVFLGGWWLIARSMSDSPEVAETEEIDDVVATGTVEESPTVDILGPIRNDAPIIQGSNETLTVEDQSAGEQVIVAHATLVRMGWIAVRDSDGRTLGAGRFEAGEHSSVYVPLLRATEKGQGYQVLIYVDDGDREFDLHEDILVMRADGSVAGTTFTAR